MVTLRIAMSQVPELELDKASLLPNPAQLKDKRDLQKSSHVYHNCILNGCIRGLNHFYFIATYCSIVEKFIFLTFCGGFLHFDVVGVLPNDFNETFPAEYLLCGGKQVLEATLAFLSSLFIFLNKKET